MAKSAIPVSVVYPEWFGAIPNDVSKAAQNTTAINNAIASLSGTGVVMFAGVNYYVDGTINVNSDFITLQGTVLTSRGVSFAHIVSTSTSADIIKIGNSTTQSEGINLKDIYVERQGGMGIAGSKSINILNTLFCNLYHCGWQDSQYGCYFGGTVSGTGLSVHDCTSPITGVITSNPIYGIYNDSSVGKSSLYLDGFFPSGNNSVDATTHQAIGIYLNCMSAGFGDNQIDNVTAYGYMTYLIAGQDNGGFAADFRMTRLSSDGIVGAGVCLTSTAPSLVQNVIIENAWFLLNPQSGNATAIQLTSIANVSINDIKCSLGSAALANKGIVLNGCPYASIKGLTHSGGGSSSVVLSTNVDSHSNRSDYIIAEIVGGSSGSVALNSSSGSVVQTASPGSPFTIASGSNNNSITGSFLSMSNSGTGNIINGTGAGITGVTAGTGLTGGGTSGTVTLSLSTPVSVARGGTATASPGLVAGTNVSISGTWPNQTINASGSGGSGGAYTAADSGGFINAATSPNYFDLCSITLSAGDYDLAALVDFRLNGATVSLYEMGISTTSGNSGAGLTFGINYAGQTIDSNSTDCSAAIPRYRVQPATSTTYYLKARVAYSAGTPLVTGSISARKW